MILDLVINAGQYSSIAKMPGVKCKINIVPIKYSLALANAFNNIQYITGFFRLPIQITISVECVGKKSVAHKMWAVIILFLMIYLQSYTFFQIVCFV